MEKKRLPPSAGGIVQYYEEHIGKFSVRPEYVIIFTLIFVLIVIILKISNLFQL